MSSLKPKTFDCVQSMRRIRDMINGEIAKLSHDDLTRWLRSHRYSEPFLQRLAERAAQQAAPADEASPRR
jgi:hypothetical protein